MKKLRVLIADDFETLRRGVGAILTMRRDIEICGEASNGQEAVRIASELKPDIVFMDFTMPVMDGLEASRQILQSFPDMPIVMFSMHKSKTLADAAKRFGLRGFITKDESATRLLEAVDKVVRNDPFFT
jgi:two-component system, NarL family, nitrate/nitrite response regulator NarL